MCVILVCPPSIRPSLEILKACERQNPDGAGVAWRSPSGSKVKWKKNLSASAVKELIDSLSGELVIHFRWASIGGRDKSLCHPFAISASASSARKGKASRVLFHNGTWSGYKTVLDGLFSPKEQAQFNAMSDTRAAAIAVAHLGRDVLKKLPGRWVIFGAKGTRLYGQWEHYDGMRVSNTYSFPAKPKKVKRSSTSCDWELYSERLSQTASERDADKMARNAERRLEAIEKARAYQPKLRGWKL